MPTGSQIPRIRAWLNNNVHTAWDLITHPCLNSLRPRRNGRHFADNIFRCILLNENIWITIQISLKFVPKGPINNIPVLVQIMAWRRPGDKPLSEPKMVSLLTHICVTRPQWVISNNSYITKQGNASVSNDIPWVKGSKRDMAFIERMHRNKPNITYIPEIILCISSANGRWCYNAMPSLIGWAHTQNGPCIHFLNIISCLLYILCVLLLSFMSYAWTKVIWMVLSNYLPQWLSVIETHWMQYCCQT